jgi:hypothetical protein
MKRPPRLSCAVGPCNDERDSGSVGLHDIV